jgi:FAD/FMN-containing dehydrogenase
MGFLTEASVIVPESVTSEDRARSLFGDNYARLQEIKGRYDPDVLFSKWYLVVGVS